jgi:hypothetical protein
MLRDKARFRCRLSQQAIDGGVHRQADPYGTRLGWATETAQSFNVTWDGNVHSYSYAKSLITRVEEQQP